ncbi:MASE3 domain-containing protein [Candidatus Reidiella endopervernicosa]|uniref:PAS domain-containing protein n=1 Tax=Candidatus Reidiella endopervernicosa TaxID=2738883 RepID=A0A6N0HT61_9GAMM|nr:MASE3 domain-containing protein [Candidatus Reidiella endopervernicosa]QKQ25573.1 PAS domain-containing protein [Candidatus Reidiella endopervernicosa]
MKTSSSNRLLFNSVAGRGWLVPIAIAALLYAISLHNYLLFHTLAELFPIMVAVIMAVVVWHTYEFSRNHFLMYLGCGYFWIAMLDLAHALYYKGMGFQAIDSANLSIQLWVITRFFEACLLISAPLFMKKPVVRLPLFTLFGAIVISTFALINAGHFPDAFIDGSGLTPFKVNSEYLIVIIMLGAIGFTYSKRTMIDPFILKLMLASISLTIFAELAFTFYISVYGLSNLVGHIFKLFSFWFIFAAIVRTTLTEPFQVMSRVSSTYDAIPDPTIVVDRHGYIHQVNKAACEMAGQPAESLINHHCHDLFHPTVKNSESCPLCDMITKGESVSNLELENHEQSRWHLYSLTPVDSGILEGMVHVAIDTTRRRQMEEALRQSRQKLALHVLRTPLAVIEWNRDFEVVEWNPAAAKIFGFSADEAFGRHAAGLILPDWAKDHVNNVWAELIDNRGGLSSTNENLTKDGRTISCDWYNTPLIDEQGEVIGVASLVQDITERKLAEELIHDEKERAQVTLHSIGDAVITTDALGTIDYLNPIAENLTGWESSEAIGKPVTEVFNIVNEFTRSRVENPVEKCLREGAIVGLANHTALIRRDSSEISIEDSAAPIRDRRGDVIGVVMVFHDVSHERELSNKLTHQASHDGLTGLFNRQEFERRLTDLLLSAREDHKEHALLYIDLDQFKIVNDTCGHIAGDELLRQLSNIFAKYVREADTVARLGGDEFGILLEACDINHAHRTADNLRLAVKEYRFAWEGKYFEIGASIGLTAITDESQGLSKVLSAADIACYAAKENGRNRVHVYVEGDTELENRQSEMQWASRIAQALKENRFRLYSQVITPVNIEDGLVPHYELLVRMVDEEGKLIPPGFFLPAAERYDLMGDIDRR